MMQASTWTFSWIGPHCGISAVADQTDSWRGMQRLPQVIATPLAKNAPASCLLRDCRPPALQVGIDGRRVVDLGKRALLLRLLFLLPLRDQGVGLGECLVEGAAGRQRFLEEGTPEIGEV